MFLSKLRLLTAVYTRSNVVQESIRRSKINFPAITQSVRTYARYIDDDDDDILASSKRAGRQEPKFSSYGQRKSFGQRKPTFGQRSNNDRIQFGGQRSRNSAFNDDIQKLRPLHYNMDELNELKKDFYQPSEITKNRSPEEIEEFRRMREISVPSDAPKPIIAFNELVNLPENLAKEIQKQNFIECTPIQAQGMPIALSGRNMVGIAQTG